MDALVFKLLCLFFLSSSLLYGGLESGHTHKKILIKGEQLTANEVLAQAASQLEINIDLDVQDDFGFKKRYDHRVTLDQVLQAVIEYFREYNQKNLEVIDRGARRVVLREIVERKPKPVSELVSAKKKVESEIRPSKSSLVFDLEDPSSIELKVNPSDSVKKTSSSKLPYELTELVTLEEPGENNKAHEKLSVEKEPSRKQSNKSEAKPMQSRIAKLTLNKIFEKKPLVINKQEKQEGQRDQQRVLKIELVGDLIEFDESVLEQKTMPKMSESRSLSHRLGGNKPVSEIRSWSERTTREWVTSPKVEQGYFGAFSPWSKPTLLNYQIEQPRSAEFKVSLGISSHEDVELAFEGIDIRTEKLILSYQYNLSETTLVYFRSGLVNHDGKLAAKGFSHRLNAAGLTDTQLGVQFIPKDYFEIGTLSLGFELSLPTGEDSDFAGSGGVNANFSTGYHVSFGRWRTQTQLNLSLLNRYDFFLLDNRSFIASYDLGVAYFHNEYLDLGWNLHWVQSPWEKGRGIWGEDGWLFQMLVQSHAWTDPLSFYVDVGLSGATPDFGFGLQWVKDFQ